MGTAMKSAGITRVVATGLGSRTATDTTGLLLLPELNPAGAGRTTLIKLT
jgi:hypothetical protein